MSASRFSAAVQPVKTAVPIAIALLSGLVVLLDRFVQNSLVAQVASLLVNWAIVLAAIALLLGLANLARRHLQLAAGKEPAVAATPYRRWHSLALLLILALTLTAGLLHPAAVDGPLSRWLFLFVQAPLQATLFSLLAFYMISAAYRVLRPGGTLGRSGWLFVAAAVLVLWSQLRGQPTSLLSDVRIWLFDVPLLAAVRGVLLGVALAATFMALRVVLGISRPYAGPEQNPVPASLPEQEVDR